MKNNIKKDICFGLENEKIVIEKLEKHFNESITQYSETFSKYDAFSDTCKYEIKSRRNSIGRYETTLITIKKVENVEGLLRIVFLFTDCLAFMEYDKTLFDTFETNNITFYRIGGVNQPVKHILIPTKHLIKIE